MRNAKGLENYGVQHACPSHPTLAKKAMAANKMALGTHLWALRVPEASYMRRA